MNLKHFPPPRSHPFNPPEILRELRAGNPIAKLTMWDGTQVWLVSRYEDVSYILRDSRFSADVTNPGLPRMSPGRVNPRPTMSRMDDPRHGEIRRMLADDFLAGRIDDLRPVIERIVMAQIEHLLEVGPPVDLHAQFSLPIPSQVIIWMLGIQPEEQETFHECSKVLTSRTVTKEEFSAADDELYALCIRLLTQKEAETSDDLLGRLVQREVHTGRLSHREAYDTTKLLIVGGHETTANMISLSTVTMLTKPELFQAMRDEPELAPSAVEELLRYHTLMHDGLPRVATKDVVVGGTLISAGEGVIVSLASGNRDESTFDSPDEFDIRRERARRHLSFGHGIHQCLGQWLARAELQIALPALATRIPTLRLAVPFEELSFKADSHIFGVRELPVTW
jgi:cytochrome P450